MACQELFSRWFDGCASKLLIGMKLREVKSLPWVGRWYFACQIDVNNQLRWPTPDEFASLLTLEQSVHHHLIEVCVAEAWRRGEVWECNISLPL